VRQNGNRLAGTPLSPSQLADSRGGTARYENGQSLNFHHLGYACVDLDEEARGLAALGYVSEGEAFEDPLQGISGRFLVGGGPRIELVCALGGSEVLQPWLRRGTKVYHSAYEVADLRGTSASLVEGRATVVSPPKPAVAFDMRHVTFLLLPNRYLIELIESGY
jgi:methylmalonyl-CoA/ethylmalonyl-CoA epimerase